MDAVQNANSGHPGTPMALAPVAYTLWDKFIKHNPQNPNWPNRDRFVLSAGHASMLLYSILHISGYKVSIDDIKKFRKLHSICAGHPEYGIVPGVETTTGPLGQGVANSVGMAIAEKWLADFFNRGEFELINYKIYAICSDGDMMEGVSSEAASLAGHLGLGNLIWIYDNNKITIEGSTDLAYSEDVGSRFESYGWQVESVSDANDLVSLENAIIRTKAETAKPSLIIVDSHIAYGSPNKQDTSESHGSPLGEEEVKLTKEFYGWDSEKKFYIPDEVGEYTKSVIEKGNNYEVEWQDLFSKYSKKYPDLAEHFKLFENNELPENWDKDLPLFPADPKGVATRNANNKIMNSIAKSIPWFLGGAADVGSSTKTYLADTSSFSKSNYSGRNFHFGIREHAMAAIINGMCLSNLKAYASTYFVFSDYMKPSIRLSSLMGIPAVYIFTHDSIGVGEDGPTHQPIEHLIALRALPGIDVIRPADANELSCLWKYIMHKTDKPTALVLTRQNVPVTDRQVYSSAEGALNGAYIVADSEDSPDIIMISTGSEVHLCLKAHEQLKKQGIKSRVVSMPCWSIFEEQTEEYKESVLPSNVHTRLSVEAGSTFGWEKYIGSNGLGKAFGINRFGESAPCNDVMDEFGFNVENIIDECKNLLKS
ncbi:MAG: transketolase [Candidatus Dadabacteria bacterium]|nr:transketolase [Candidatus Dadabacteria bacterium]